MTPTFLRNAPNGLTRFCLRAGGWDRWLVQRPPPPAVARCSLLSATEWNRFCCQLQWLGTSRFWASAVAFSSSTQLRGTLWQDLPSQHPSDIEHHMNPPYDAFGHNVSLRPALPWLHCSQGRLRLRVNSYHHQAVREPAAGLEVMAVAPDGVIEALYRPASHFLWAVQWHPEFSTR